jgi:hypothetical protein
MSLCGAKKKVYKCPKNIMESRICLTKTHLITTDKIIIKGIHADIKLFLHANFKSA